MLFIVVMIGALNLGLGFGLALLLERPIHIPWSQILHLRAPLRRRLGKAPSASTGTIPTETPPTPTVGVKSERPVVVHNDYSGLPKEWAKILSEHAVPVNSFLEAQLRVTRIEMAGDRSLLAQLDPQASELRREFPISELQAFTSKCRSALAGWHEAIGNARDQGEYAEKVQQCDQWFQELMQHIQHAEQTLAPASSDSPEVDRDALRKEMHKLFGHVCLLRDRCDELLTRLLRSEKRIEGLHPDEYIDPNSSTLNRLGMERAIKEWTDKDPDRVRMASVILIDVDQCAELNEQHGLKVMDGLLSSLRSLASELIRKDRGFDRVAAIDGQTLLVFLGDTALRNATTGAERIRQTVMSTTFKAEKQQLGLTLSCAVAEWQSNESFDELVMRLRAGLVQAKQAGRNCTTVCTPEEVRVAQCSRMQVASREIAITT